MTLMNLESVRTIHRRRDGVQYDIEVDFRSKHVELRRFTGASTELLGAGRWIDERIQDRSAAPPKSIFDWAEAELREELRKK
jgi:hypothetical protein